MGFIEIPVNYSDSFKNAAWFFLRNQARDTCNLPAGKEAEEIQISLPDEEEPITLLDYYAEKIRRDTINWIKKESVNSIDSSVGYTPKELDLSILSRLQRIVNADVKLYVDNPICPPWPGAEKQEIQPIVVREKADAGVSEAADAGMQDVEPDIEPKPDVAPKKKRTPGGQKRKTGKKPGRRPKTQKWRPIK